MIPSDLLDFLRCPQTSSPLSLAGPELLLKINARIRQHDPDIRNQAGTAVDQELEEGLVCSDATVIYPVRDGIPVLLADEAILLPLP